ncbi:MAG: pyrroline-5-carboxylate reductase [Desulfobulbus propionicus]|nr:MAG: pyrroline-5-carboxylate reductase [Desulfobulbus propionicus]
METTKRRCTVINKKSTVGLIGGGQMAEALIKGVLQADLFSSEQLTVLDPSVERKEHLGATYNIGTADTSEELAAKCRVLLLAVKPQIYHQVLSRYAACFTPRHLLISIMAGIPLSSLEKCLPEESRIIRVMPNTPCLVMAGASAFSSNMHVQDDDKELCRRIFSAVGYCLEVSESQLDAVTGLSGSGPGYVFSLMDGFIDGGVLAGLSRPVAQQLVLHTFYGAAKLALESGATPADLKAQVTSPGGTTIRGIQVLEQHGVRAACMESVLAAADRSKELGA